MKIPPNMTLEQVVERHHQRQSILTSAIAAEYASFSLADAIRHLSNYKNGAVVTEGSAKALLEKMADEGLLVKTRANSKTRYAIPKPNFITRGWGVTDNGVGLGLHQPPSPEVLRGEVEYVSGPAYQQAEALLHEASE